MDSMRSLIWISGREIGRDLASTTEISICNSLNEMGINVALVCPGSIQQSRFEHIGVSKWDIPGLNTISGARAIKRKIIEGEIQIDQYEVLLVDWRYVTELSKELREVKIPWIIVDRGPPAYSGILARIQKKYWANGWFFAQKYASGALVVSNMHENFVKKRLDIGLKMISVPAGCSPNEFLESKIDPKEELRLIYSGRLDKKRGVSKIIHLSSSLESRNLNHKIYIAGNGDLSRNFEIQSKKNENLEFMGKLDFAETKKLYAGCHLGIMPMPNIPIWSIASPLKLAEYLSSGLAIIGPYHLGNTTEESGKWDLLSKNGMWWGESDVEALEDYISKWKEVSKSALVASEKLSWDSITNRLVKELPYLIRANS